MKRKKRIRTSDIADTNKIIIQKTLITRRHQKSNEIVFSPQINGQAFVDLAHAYFAQENKLSCIV